MGGADDRDSTSWQSTLSKSKHLSSLCSSVPVIFPQVVANQVVLGPCVLLVVFAWNFTWMGKMKDIPDKYRRDFFPALVDGMLPLYGPDSSWNCKARPAQRALRPCDSRDRDL